MAKMTDEQKAANKEASLLKRAAHVVRKKELDAAEAAAKAMVDGGSLRRACEAANAAASEARDLRKNLVSAIEAQIAALNDRIREIRAEHDPKIERLDELCREAANKAHFEYTQMLHEVRVGFPDMATCDARWFSAKWVPPEGYIERFAEEHAEELAESKAKRETKARKRMGI